jgi:hypothetical protein
VVNRYEQTSQLTQRLLAQEKVLFLIVQTTTVDIGFDITMIFRAWVLTYLGRWAGSIHGRLATRLP